MHFVDKTIKTDDQYLSNTNTQNASSIRRTETRLRKRKSGRRPLLLCYISATKKGVNNDNQVVK